MTDDFIDDSGDDPSAPQEPGTKWLSFDPRMAPMPSETLPRAARTTDEELIAADEAAVISEVTDRERVVRIADELSSAFEQMRAVGHGVTVFGSARTPEGTEGYTLARKLGGRLGDAGLPVITGGGPGAMEAANRGAAEAGAHSVGLRIELPFEQGTNEFVNLDIKFHYFFTRKVCFVRYACAFVVLPGGFGTLDELFETLCLIQTEKVRQRPVILMGERFWRGLIDWSRDSMLAEGMISAEDLDLFHICDDVDEVVRICSDASSAVNADYRA